MEVVEEEPEVDEEQEREDLIENQIRTHKALQHMEMLQLPSATVMPVLLQLVKVRNDPDVHFSLQNGSFLFFLIWVYDCAGLRWQLGLHRGGQLPRSAGYLFQYAGI